MPRSPTPKLPRSPRRARGGPAQSPVDLTFAGWVRKWKLGPGMNDRHPEILGMLRTLERLDPDFGAQVRALHAEGLYSGYDGVVGPGWLPLLDRLVADLVALGWDRDLHQVKSKFWALRFYIGESTEALDRRIRAAEREALRTCCECGRRVPAEVRVADVSRPGYCKACLEKELRGGRGSPGQ